MLNKTGRAAAAAFAAAIALAGCTSGSTSPSQQFFDASVLAEGAAKLDSTVMAFFVGPQNDEMYTVVGEVHKPGYVVLVKADGTFHSIATKRMDMMRPAWSEHGLYFADEDSDYRLTASGLTKFANAKVTAQNLGFALPDGGSVGVYNGGNGNDGGYNNQIAVTTNTAARVYDVQGNYFTGALCDGQVFGLTNNPGTHAGQAPKSAGMISATDDTAVPQMLARLYPADGGEKIVGWRPQFGSGTPIGQVPCHDGVISFLSWETDAAGQETPKIVSWNTVTGEHQEHGLTFDGAATQLTFEDFGYVVQDWRDGRLHWVYADGRVFATDAATGKTTALFDTGLGTGPSRPTRTLYAFSDGQLHVLSTLPGGEGNIKYTSFDRGNGKVTHEVSVPIPNTEVNISYLNLSHMAVPAHP